MEAPPTPVPDFLALEPLIVERIRSHLDPSVFVFAAPDLDGVVERSQHVPAVHVLYQGYRINDAKTAAFVSVTQEWVTVVAVRNARDARAGQPARAEAGELAWRVIAALQQWTPPLPGAKPLRMADTLAAGFNAGYFYLPIGWTADITMRTAACSSK